MANNNAMFNFSMSLRIPHRPKPLKIILTMAGQGVESSQWL